MDIGFVCRRHPSPTKEMLEPLLRTAAAVGLNLDVSSSKALADSLDHAVVRLLCYCIYLLAQWILHSGRYTYIIINFLS